MQKQKVMYVITKSVWGGAQRYLYDLTIHLPKDKFEPIVICGGEGVLAKRLRHSQVPTITIPFLVRDIGILADIRTILFLVKRFLKYRPDVIHLNSSKIGVIGSFAGIIYKIITFRFDSQIIFTVHGWPFLEARPRWERGVFKIFLRIASLFQNTVILIDHYDYEAATRFIPLSKLRLIPNGITPFSTLSREAARAFLAAKTRCAIEPDTAVIGSIGELIKNKRYDSLIAALKKTGRGNLKAIIMGEGDERPTLEARIRKERLADTIFLPGFIPDAPRYLSAFDLFVLPSEKEGLPYVILEAMTAGVPIIATAVGGIPDLITHEKTGILVPPGDEAALSNAIDNFLVNPARAKAMAEEARQQANKRFTIEAMIEHTIQTYQPSHAR